jgi:hypothetical protein
LLALSVADRTTRRIRAIRHAAIRPAAFDWPIRKFRRRANAGNHLVARVGHASEIKSTSSDVLPAHEQIVGAGLRYPGAAIDPELQDEPQTLRRL